MRRELFLILILSLIYSTICSFAQHNPLYPYPPIQGSWDSVKVMHSPDPLASYHWESPKASNGLEIYSIEPISVVTNMSAHAEITDPSSLFISGPCNLKFDFGQVNAAWFEFDSDDLEGEIEMSISEFNEPAVFNAGSQSPRKTAVPVKYGNTWRLELNDALYEGVRYAWIHIRSLHKPATIRSPRLICQTKPANYAGSFSSNDTLLTRMWYTGAYTVRLNLLKDHFGAILMERSDRHSWTGDAHTSQAASMVAFGNYDFVRENLRYTSTQYNGIASYSLYWVLSLIDYYNYTADRTFLEEMLENACSKLMTAYQHYGSDPDLSFYGWDERLGAGFENPSNSETQNAYKMLSIRSWMEFSEVLDHAGYPLLRDQFKGYAVEKIRQLRSDAHWMMPLGIHAAADAVNAGFADADELERIWQNAFTDRLQRLSYSPFNQYFIIRSMAAMQRYPEALTTIHDCWGGQLRYGATTFFEVFRSSWNQVSAPNDAPINNQCGYTSLTHPWSAGITKWLSEEILGIQPLEPGFATFIVRPHLTATVTRVSGETPTLKGKIKASFNLLKGEHQLSVPHGTSATLCIPKAGMEIQQIDFSGKRYRASGEDDRYVYFTNLPEGEYRIKVKYKGKPMKAKEEELRYGYDHPSEDVITQGNWQEKYGSNGYILFNYDSLAHKMVYPGFIEKPIFNKQGNIHWATGTSDSRALEDSDGTRSIGAFITRDPIACEQTMTIDLPVQINHPYKVSLYFVDWERSKRRSAIEIFDLETKELLAPVYMVRDYSEGKYVSYLFDRSVRIRINQVRGANAAVSGIFFD